MATAIYGDVALFDAIMKVKPPIVPPSNHVCSSTRAPIL
jgi:hypothetical protein